MWLRRIEADRLRNLRAVSVELAPGLTVLAGRNGQGKTSVLEAIYLLATSRSFRTRTTTDLQSWDGGPARVAGSVSWRGGKTEVGVVIDGAARRLLVDGIERDLPEFLGRLDIVDLTGQRMLVLRGPPDERRRFLDRGVVGLKPSFLASLGDYRRALAHRNALLRTLGGGAAGRRGTAELEAWDERVAAAAGRVHRERRRYAFLLAGGLGGPGRLLFREGERLVARYDPSPARAGKEDPSRFETVLQEELGRRRERDLGLGFTSVGPHRDDLVVELDGVDLRKFGSAGQIRASMITIKLRKLEILRDEHGEAPVFLMDDFDADLDEARLASLAGFLQEGRFQTVVATSKEDMAGRLGVPAAIIRMVSGEARPTGGELE